MPPIQFRHYLTPAILLLLSACSSENDPPLDPTMDAGFFQNQTFSMDSINRDYHLYLPENRNQASIVFIMHGNSGSSDQVVGLEGTKAPHRLWLDIAERENLILVVPNGLPGNDGNRGWNDCRNDAPTIPDSDDVAFISALIDTVQSEYSGGLSPVFFVGTSNGGHMTMRLAEEIPEKLTAVATLVASKPVNTECADASVVLPILIMNGTEDPLVPFEGGSIASNRGEVYSTPDMVAYWVNRNLASVNPIEEAIADIDPDDESTITRSTYTNSSGDAVVEYYEVRGGGHTEPSIAERYGRLFKLIVGTQNGDIEMAEVVWEFFDSVN
ncbi:MAG: hypothetical protein KTR32_26505 [Granulosicoccus sp.]|nr:hypothetical protein [Granulosicoccus sp.]